LRQALVLDPNNERSLLHLAWMKLEHWAARPGEAGPKELEEAVAACRRVLEKDPKNVTALGYQGVALRRLERFPEAIETLERALQLEPKSYVHWTNIGALHLMMHDLEKAEEGLTRSAELAGPAKDDPYRATAWRNLAAFELLRHKPTALEHLRTAIECNEHDVLSWALQAFARLESSAPAGKEEALDDAKHADRLANARSARAKRILAFAYLRAGQWEHAVTEASAALALNDLPTVNRLVIAAAEAKRGGTAAAKEAVAAAQATWPEQLRKPGNFAASVERGELWIESADLLLQLRDEAEAVIGEARPATP
jgi:tetratricopeptide (TPR) repeat protein